jgi:hypothetical protein
MMNTGKEYILDEIGVLAPVKTPVSVSGFKYSEDVWCRFQLIT